MAISRRLGGAALAFAAGFASAARAQDPAAVIRAALGTDAIAVVVVPDPPAARAALTAAIGSLPDDLPAEVRAFAGLGLLALRRALGGSLAEFVQTVAAGGAAFGLAVDPVDADETAGAPLLLLAVRPGDPDAAYERLAHLPAHVRCERAGELLLLSTAASGIARLQRAVAAVDPSTGGQQRDGVLATAHVDLAALFARRPAPEPAGLDAGARFVLAPLLAAVGSARRLELALAVAPAADGAEHVVRLTAAVDGSAHGTRWAGLLTAAGDARLPSAPPGSVAQIAFGRSVGALLRAPAEYLGSGEQLALQSFLSIADAIDGPQTSFTADLVGGLAEPWVLTVLGPVAGEGPHSPLVLPRFALSAGIADAEVETVLRRAAQVFAVIANGQRAQQRKLPFVVRNARTAHGRGLVAEPPVWRGPGLPPVEDALTPALLFGAGHAVLASTLDAAEAVLAALAQGRPAPGGGDHIRIDGGAVASALAANRGPLELGRMLDEGDSASEAARFVDIVLAVAAATARLELAIDYGDGATTLRLELERRR